MVLLFGLVFFSSISNEKEKIFTKRYNLEFVLSQDGVAPWLPYMNQCLLKVDSSFTFNNKPPLKIYTEKNQHILTCNLFQRILLPNTQFSNIEISLTSNALNIDNAKLLVDRISNDEKIFATDTLIIHNTDTLWNTISYRFPSVNMRFIGFRLLINGFNKNEKFFWVDRLNILLDNKSIDEFSLPNISPFSIKQPDSIMNLSFREDLYSCIPELNSRKIVALGETIHGSASINELTAQIIKHQVSKNNCKLILFELPFEMMMFLNKEIQGEKNFNGDSIIQSYEPLFDYPVLEDLIKWLTQYNKNHKDNQVTLMGTDINLLESENMELLSQYVACLNDTFQNKILENFCDKLSRHFIESGTALTYLKEHSEIKEILSSVDYCLMKHNLEISQKASPFVTLRLDNRDQILKENAVFLIDLFTHEKEKVIVWTHFNHANYTTVYPGLPIPSFGSYMKDVYGDQYSCLGLLIGNGEILVNSINNTKITKNLPSPPVSSIENYFNRQTEDYLYCSSANFIDSLSHIRAIGQPYLEKNQYLLIDPKSRMDGVIFIKTSLSAALNKDCKQSTPDLLNDFQTTSF